MKRDVIEYIAICITCQRVKDEHEGPTRMLQPLQVLEWKWEEVAMDFVVGLPTTQSGHDFPFGNCGLTGQGSSLHTHQNDIHCTSTGRVV
jgi:hypothetical protein